MEPTTYATHPSLEDLQQALSTLTLTVTPAEAEHLRKSLRKSNPAGGRTYPVQMFDVDLPRQTVQASATHPEGNRAQRRARAPRRGKGVTR